MRFLPICLSVLLLAAGAGCSAYLLERLAPRISASPFSGAVLTFALLALLCHGPPGEGRLGTFRALRRGDDDLRRVDLDGDRPSRARGLILPGFVDRLTRLSGYELALIAGPPPGFAISFMLWFEVLIDSFKYLESGKRRAAGRVRSLWQVEAARPKVSAPPRQTPGHPARPAGARAETPS